MGRASQRLRLVGRPGAVQQRLIASARVGHEVANHTGRCRYPRKTVE
jgi:hypothetical protein